MLLLERLRALTRTGSTPAPAPPGPAEGRLTPPLSDGPPFFGAGGYVPLDSNDLATGSGETPGAPNPVFGAGDEPIPGFRLDRWLGSGGTGDVWRAVAPGGVPVALKFVRVWEADFAAQARSLDLIKAIRHAHLLPMFGAWRTEQRLVIGMELADGTLLDRFHDDCRRGLPGIPFAPLIEAMRQAALGIDFLNGVTRAAGPGETPPGIQHRDVKPENLFFVGGCVKVGDFGLAKVLEGAVARNTGSLTPSFAAPELFRGEVSSRSDQYSLAVTYCQLRAGVLPFTGGPAAVTAGHLYRAPDLDALPRAERPVVARALAKRPEHRWPDCGAFVEALARAQQPRNPDASRAAVAALVATGLVASVVALTREPAAPRPERLAPGPNVPSVVAVAADAPGPRPVPAPSPALPAVVAVDAPVPRPAPAPAATLPDDPWAPWPVGPPRPEPETPAPAPRPATIIALMPCERSELVVKGAVGRGNPDEWFGPKRVIHTPPFVEPKTYLVGAFWTDEAGRPAARKDEIRVEPGMTYEVDLRGERPTSRKLP